jgi:hypothetical protein
MTDDIAEYASAWIVQLITSLLGATPDTNDIQLETSAACRW